MGNLLVPVYSCASSGSVKGQSKISVIEVFYWMCITTHSPLQDKGHYWDLFFILKFWHFSSSFIDRASVVCSSSAMTGAAGGMIPPLVNFEWHYWKEWSAGQSSFPCFVPLWEVGMRSCLLGHPNVRVRGGQWCSRRAGVRWMRGSQGISIPKTWLCWFQQPMRS